MSRGRRALRALAVLTLLLVGLLVGALVVSQTAWFRERVRRLAMRQADAALDGTLVIGAVEGNLLGGVVLRDVVLSQHDVPVVRVGRVQVDYALRDVLGAGRVVRRIVVDRPVIDAVHTPEGWNVAHLLKPRPPVPPDSPRATFTLPDITVTNGQLTVREHGVSATTSIPRRVEGLTFEGAVTSRPHELGIDVRRLTFRTGQPDLDLRSLAGRVINGPSGWRFQSIAARTGESDVTVDGSLTRAAASQPWTFDMDVAGTPISLPEIGRFFPAASFEIRPNLTVGMSGTLDALGLEVDVTRSEAGRAAGQMTLDATGPGRGLRGSLDLTDVDLAPVVHTPVATGRITGKATFDLRFPSASEGFPVDGVFTFAGPRASAYGYEATNVRAKGALDGRRIRLDASVNAYGGSASTAGTIARAGRGQRELALDLSGRFAGMDLRRLPEWLRVPALESDLSGQYTVRGPLSVLEAQATLAAATVEGATLSDGTTGRFARTPGGYTFAASGTVEELAPQRLGAALDLAAMTDPNLAGVVNGTFEVSGEERGEEGLRVEATGALTDTTTYDGRLPEATFDLTLDDSRLDVAVRGRLEGFELETLTGVPAATGRIAGRVDGRVTIPDVGSVSVDTVGVDGTVTLDSPVLLDVPFATVTADVSVANGLATIRRLEGRGEGFALTASGAIALGQAGVSDLRYRLDADSLVRPAMVADLPVTGAALAEGRVTGPRADILIEGTVAGDQVAWNDVVAAGTVTAQYAVRLPDWDADRVDAQVSVDGQQVQVAGQILPVVTGTVGYTDRLVRFDVTGTDATRDLEARGTLRLEDALQRLTLDHAQVSRGDVRWGLAPDTTARAVITPRQATIGALQLARGHERVTVEGTVGLEADATSSLRVDATGVDVGDLLVLAAQEVDVDGTLTLSATLGGTRERPLADAQIEITEGRVRTLNLQRAGGRVTFDGTLALVDLEVVKDADARLTARGVVPLTLFESADAGHVQPTVADRLDLAVLSTPIDLALAEGLTSYVTRLDGQAQIDVRLTGSGRDPHVEGAVFVRNGTFHVPLAGVTYRKLDAALTFEEERVVISELGVETEDGDLLEVQGELGLSREQARTVNLRLKGRDFRVLDNEFGQLDLDADLTIGGTVIAPVVEGSVGLSDGRLELDEILPAIADTAYATKAEYQGIPTERLRGHIVPDILGADDSPPALAPGVTTFTLDTTLGPPADAGAGTDGQDGASAGEPLPSVFEETALNIQVRIPDNLLVRGQSIEAARASVGDLNATLGGDFRVAKTAGKPAVLLGVVNTVRGTYAYQGRRFDIVRDGQIQFRGNEEIDPRIDISAQRVIQGVEARVRIQGTAREPQISLSSTPPLDEGDILALIVFNQPLNQLGTGQQTSLGQRAGGIAAGLVASPLAEALGNSLDLDQFDVETTDQSGRVNPAVVIGEQVTQDLFLRFRQQFGNQQVSQFLLEYRLASFLRLQGNVAEGDGLSAGNRSLMQRIERYGVDLVFYFSF